MKFTIVIAVYNGEEFINNAVQSILAQTYKDWELIIVNDGSNDNTEEIILKIIKNNQARNIYLINQENKGLGAARNTAIKNSTGDYVALLDADDIWYEGKLRAIYDILIKANDIDVICHDEYIVKKNTNFKHRVYYGPQELCNFHDLLFKKNVISSSASTIKKERLLEVGLFSENREWHGAEDYDMWLKLAKIGAKFFFLNEVYGEYTLHDNNMTADIDSFNVRALNVIEFHVKQLSHKTFFHHYLFVRRRAKMYQDAAVNLFKNKKFSLGFSQFIKSLKI
jgi:glycosyltransferase involved in cell wall biosynthesis